MQSDRSLLCLPNRLLFTSCMVLSGAVTLWSSGALASQRMSVQGACLSRKDQVHEDGLSLGALPRPEQVDAPQFESGCYHRGRSTHGGCDTSSCAFQRATSARARGVRERECALTTLCPPRIANPLQPPAPLHPPARPLRPCPLPFGPLLGCRRNRRSTGTPSTQPRVCSQTCDPTPQTTTQPDHHVRAPRARWSVARLPRVSPKLHTCE